MDWVRARRFLLMAFLGLDIFLFVLLRTNGPASALPGVTASTPSLPGQAVSDPLPTGKQDVREVDFTTVTAEALLSAIFPAMPQGRLQTDGSVLYASGGEVLLAKMDGSFVVTYPSLSVAPKTLSDATADAQVALAGLPLPTLKLLSVTKQGKTSFEADYVEMSGSLPVFGSTVRALFTPNGKTVITLRVYDTRTLGPSQAILPAGAAVAYYVASGGSQDIRSIALGYPGPRTGGSGKTYQEPPVWRIQTGSGTVLVNAFTGEEQP